MKFDWLIKFIKNLFVQDELGVIEDQLIYIKELDNQIKELKYNSIIRNDMLNILSQEIIDLEEELDELSQLVLELSGNTKLDVYCKLHFTKIPKIAYKQKRAILGQNYTISLHELVTPDSWEVHNLFKKVDKNGTIKEVAKRIGDKTSNHITWDSDNNLNSSGDYYLTPAETISRKKGDCEDHVFVNMSANINIGGAWGFLNKTGGHAYNVFVQDDELYILETTGNSGQIHKWKGNNNDRYTINYIITKNNAYRVKGGVTFGELAGW